MWLGGVAEPFVQGGRVGPLFSCLIANQFKDIRQGDRYAYSKVWTWLLGSEIEIRVTRLDLDDLCKMMDASLSSVKVQVAPLQYPDMIHLMNT